MDMRKISNQEIAQILREIADHLEIQGIAWKPRAYEKAARSIESVEEELHDLYKDGGPKALDEIPAVGKAIAGHIEELLKTGRLKRYEQLKKKTPVKMDELTRVEGLGPKKIKFLYEKLGIRNLKDLERAAKGHKIAGLKGMGEKTEENILKGIEFVRKSSGRMMLGDATSIVYKIEERIGRMEDVLQITSAGSFRRRKETIGDIDILVTSQNSENVIKSFVKMPNVARVYSGGKTKSSVRLKEGLDADLRVVPEESYGAALNYFTGSKEHNVALRKLAMKRGWKLNEYGLFKQRANGKWQMIAGKNEEEIYKKLGMDYIEPEMRENTGELELARAHKLPKLVEYGGLKGDLQVHTDWSDGSDSIEKMASEAMRRGLDYMAVTDHTKNLAMTGGLDDKRIKKQWVEIDTVNKKLRGKFRVLKGTECDILRDGSLDLKNETLSELDVVGVSIHSYFNLSKKEQTKRVRRAISNPNVDIWLHPTARRIGKRPPVELDMEELIKLAKKTGTIMEANASPERLDLCDTQIRMCVEHGVKLAVSSDAHNLAHFDWLEYGLSQARRGFAQKKDIINAWPIEKMLKNFK